MLCALNKTNNHVKTIPLEQKAGVLLPGQSKVWFLSHFGLKKEYSLFF